jgi:bifunctional DNA-binding transcriptional regulator/antitoxin component of YhaV-PrlF toxin-antitoxin module
MAKKKVLPLIDKKCRLEKFPGKGGWTFARIPEISAKNKTPFGWKRVKGSIDGYEIKRYHLMPMGNGILFLPVKAEIRKKIKKKEGDFVHIILYPDTDPLEIPDELLLCLSDEPEALRFFKSISESEQNYYIQWIYAAKREETKISRIAKTVNRLLRGMKMYDKEDN